MLHTAHKELQRLVTTETSSAFRALVSVQYADIVYNGLWFTPLREALDAYVDNVQERVTGVVRLKLFKGDCRVVGRKSRFALYDHALATYDAGDAFDHGASPASSRSSACRRNSAESVTDDQRPTTNDQ